MRISFSQTGSNGNCSVIESRYGNLLIIDAGIKYKTVDKAIGYRLHTADSLLITHAHKDHTHYLDDFIYARIKVFISHKTLSGCNIYGCKDNYWFIDEQNKIDINGFVINSFELVHTHVNGTPCECYGFLILDKSTGEKMLWATDTQYIKNRFPPLDFYCIECNFFEQNDYEGELDYIEKSVEQRRVQSHMSFESCVKFLKQQDLSKCKEIHLLHLSTKMDDKERKSVVRKMKRALKKELEGKDVQIYA